MLNADPSDPNFKVPDMLPRTISRAARGPPPQLARDGGSLVSEFENISDARLLDSTFQQAYTLIFSQRRAGLELHREPEACAKYGLNLRPELSSGSAA
jgi:hypothetical protein